MHRLSTSLPQDRLRTLADSSPLADPSYGSAIFADISGFTRFQDLSLKIAIATGSAVRGGKPRNPTS